MTLRQAGGVALLGVLGCNSQPARTPAADSTTAPAIPDSLALTAVAGVEIWFTGARPAVDSAGQPCTERVMEIRRDNRRVAIPLLYTGERPRLVNDSTIEVPIWLHCRPGNVYRVNLTTGQPVRVR